MKAAHLSLELPVLHLQPCQLLFQGALRLAGIGEGVGYGLPLGTGIGDIGIVLDQGIEIIQEFLESSAPMVLFGRIGVLE